MTLKRARKLLGKIGEQYSDKQVLSLLGLMKIFADACADKIDNRIKSEGSGFLSIGKMQ